jgi:lipopolysaccharide transport protein LptA
MNRSLLTLLFAAGLGATLNAQTNAPAAADRNVVIDSNEWEFDLKAKVSVHRGNVRAEAQGMHLTCEKLTAKLPATGSRIESFVGESNIVINFVDEKGQKYHGTGDKLIYTFAASAAATNETAELLGHPVLETSQGSMTGDVMVYDLITRKLTVLTNVNTSFRAETRGKTNQVVSPTNEPVARPSPP